MAIFINRDNNKTLCILDLNNDGKSIKSYAIKKDGHFSVEFVHSVNKSPVEDFYKFDDDNNIYVYKTIYYHFGAGVQTELNEGETFDIGPDNEMIVSHIDKKIDNLSYYVGTVSDHILTIDDKRKISLRDTCGKNAHIRFVVR